MSVGETRRCQIGWLTHPLKGSAAADKPKVHSRDHLARLELRAQVIQSLPDPEVAIWSEPPMAPVEVYLHEAVAVQYTITIPCTTSWGGQRQSKSVVFATDTKV